MDEIGMSRCPLSKPTSLLEPFRLMKLDAELFKWIFGYNCFFVLLGCKDKAEARVKIFV